MFGGEETKWYNHDVELTNISKEHKDYTFILSGFGEESGDIWTSYCKNGRMTTWRPEIDPPGLTPELEKFLNGKTEDLPHGFTVPTK